MRIVGNVFIDFNGNGIMDGSDVGYDRAIVKSVKTGGFTQYGIPYHGAYENDVDTGNYTTTVIPDKPYYTITPVSKTSSFAAYKLSDTVNFALQPITGKRDYAVALGVCIMGPIGSLRRSPPAYTILATPITEQIH